MRNIMDMRNAPDRLRSARVLEGLTQAELALLLSCSRKTVLNLEMGHTSPLLRIAAAIERRYGIPSSAWEAANAGTGKDAA